MKNQYLLLVAAAVTVLATGNIVRERLSASVPLTTEEAGLPCNPNEQSGAGTTGAATITTPSPAAQGAGRNAPQQQGQSTVPAPAPSAADGLRWILPWLPSNVSLPLPTPTPSAPQPQQNPFLQPGDVGTPPAARGGGGPRGGSCSLAGQQCNQLINCCSGQNLGCELVVGSYTEMRCVDRSSSCSGPGESCSGGCCNGLVCYPGQTTCSIPMLCGVVGQSCAYRDCCTAQGITCNAQKICEQGTPGACSTTGQSCASELGFHCCQGLVCDEDLGRMCRQPISNPPGNSCTSGVCCNMTTGVFKPAGTVCHASAGICDVAETCTGTSTDCPVDAFQPNTVVCRNALPDPGSGTRTCDAPETCSGTSTTCPTDDIVLPAGTPCRAPADHAPTGQIALCDREEVCNGPGDKYCPADTPVPANSVVCRGAAGSCDIEEKCVGYTCPADQKKMAGTACTAQYGPGECNGTSNMCNFVAQAQCAGAPAPASAGASAGQCAYLNTQLNSWLPKGPCEGMFQSCQVVPSSGLCECASSFCQWFPWLCPGYSASSSSASTATASSAAAAASSARPPANSSRPAQASSQRGCTNANCNGVMCRNGRVCAGSPSECACMAPALAGCANAAPQCGAATCPYANGSPQVCVTSGTQCRCEPAPPTACGQIQNAQQCGTGQCPVGRHCESYQNNTVFPWCNCFLD